MQHKLLHYAREFSYFFKKKQTEQFWDFPNGKQQETKTKVQFSIFKMNLICQTFTFLP